MERSLGGRGLNSTPAVQVIRRLIGGALVPKVSCSRLPRLRSQRLKAGDLFQAWFYVSSGRGLHTESFVAPFWLSPMAPADCSLPAPCRGQSLICRLPEEAAWTVPLTSSHLQLLEGEGGPPGVVRAGPALTPCH